ncbi:phosphoglycerate mutase family protein [Candidatus Uabimicrobium helgolandensis]
MSRIIKLYLARHAEPQTLHYKNYFPGPPLGQRGIKQAHMMAKYLRNKNIQQVYTSNFTRVIQTLQPFLDTRLEQVSPTIEKALWEREKEVESHESLVERVTAWIRNKSNLITSNTAIFSHCGPINMILQYFDPQKTVLDYLYTCPFLCHTPFAGIWELNLQDFCLVDGKLIFVEDMES